MNALADFFGSIASGDMPDYDLADGMAEVASDDFATVSKALGDDGIVDKATAKAALMDGYFREIASAELDEARSFSETLATYRNNVLADSMFAHAGLSDSEAVRVRFDETVGDTLPAARVRAKFYFD